MQFKFSQSLIDQVKSSYLITQNASEFDRCKTDSDICLTFLIVSNTLQECTGLADKIGSVVVSEIHAASK